MAKCEFDPSIPEEVLSSHQYPALPDTSLQNRNLDTNDPWTDVFDDVISELNRPITPRSPTPARTPTPAMSIPLTDFTCFPRLPLELRCMIWKASAQPRLVEISYELPDGFYSTARYPEALTACRESRNALLPQYPLCFGTIFHPAMTRFNFAIDTLYIDNSFEEDVPHLFSALNDKELKGIQWVAVDSYFNGVDSREDFEFVVHLRRAMRCLKGLQELQIVFDIQVLSDRTLGCGQEDHAMEIHEKLPKELRSPGLRIAPLPEDVELEEFDMWKVKKVKPVYGWRKCPVGFDPEAWEGTRSGRGYDHWGDEGERLWSVFGGMSSDDDSAIDSEDMDSIDSEDSMGGSDSQLSDSSVSQAASLD